MRELKFRAWDKINKRILTHDLLVVSLRNIGKGRQFEYMQFTGLLDKHGKEIYEGDVVVESAPRGCKFLVKWDGEVAGFHLERISDKGYFPIHQGSVDLLKDAEILGNKWEHPELLEGQK